MAESVGVGERRQSTPAVDADEFRSTGMLVRVREREAARQRADERLEHTEWEEMGSW